MLKNAHEISIPQTLAEAVRPDTTALIVYDMQVGFLRQLKHGPDVLARVLKVLSWRAPPACASSSCATCRCRRSSPACSSCGR